MQWGMSEGMSRTVASLVRMLERPFNDHYLMSSEELLGMWLSFSYYITIITSLVAIHFSETSNIRPLRVSNREIWHRHR